LIYLKTLTARISSVLFGSIRGYLSQTALTEPSYGSGLGRLLLASDTIAKRISDSGLGFDIFVKSLALFLWIS
jgi:hypothetical protein